MLGRRLSVWTGTTIAALAAAAPAFPQVPSAAPTPPVLSRSLSARPAVGVDWPAAALASQRYANQAPRLSRGLDRAALDRTRLPVLLPTDADLMKGARLYSFGDHYTISADVEGAGVSLTGTTATVSAKKPLAVSPQGPGQLVVQRTVDGQLASFVRYGVLYTAEVRCDLPADARCHTEAYVRQLAGKLTAPVLGKAARKAAGLEG